MEKSAILMNIYMMIIIAIFLQVMKFFNQRILNSLVFLICEAFIAISGYFLKKQYDIINENWI